MKQALTNEIISAAIAGFEAQRKHIDTQIAELRNILNGRRMVASTPAAGVSEGQAKISAAVRRRMAVAPKKRGPEITGQSKAVSQAAAPEAPKRRISEEGIKRIIAANKKRAALKRAEAAKAIPAAAKKAAAARKKITPKKTAAV